MAAVIATLSVWQIPFPFGVPLTFQVFAVALAGYVLGWGRGSLATLIFIAIGAVGVPVFSGFIGGVGVLLGPAGGFVIGFLPLALLSGLGMKKKPFLGILFGMLGLCVCHLIGILQYSFVESAGILQAFLAVSLPYAVKDAALVVGAYFLAVPIRKRTDL